MSVGSPPKPTTDKIVRECIHKVAQIIYRSRVPNLQEGSKVNTMFNLRIKTIPAVRDTMSKLISSTGNVSINIDVFVVNHSSKILLERWSLDYELFDSSYKSRKVDQRSMYENMLILVRTLYSKVLFLPAHPLFKATQFSDDRKFTLEADASIPTKDPPPFDSSPLNFVFAPVMTPEGKFHFSVFYRKDCSFEFTQTSTPSVHIDKIIPDYAGTKTATTTTTTTTSSSATLPIPTPVRMFGSSPSSPITPTTPTTPTTPVLDALSGEEKGDPLLMDGAQFPTSSSSASTPTSLSYRRSRSDSQDSARRRRNSVGRPILEPIPDDDEMRPTSLPIPIVSSTAKRRPSTEDALRATPPFAFHSSSPGSGSASSSFYTPRMTPPQFGVSNGIFPASERRGSETRETLFPLHRVRSSSLSRPAPRSLLGSPSPGPLPTTGPPSSILNLMSSTSRSRKNSTETALPVRSHIPRTKTWTPSALDPDFVSNSSSYDNESAVGSFLKGIKDLPPLQMFSDESTGPSSSSPLLINLLSQLDHFGSVSRTLSMKYPELLLS